MSDIVQQLMMIVASGNGGAFEDHIAEAANEIERLRDDPKWISVAERMPDNVEEVLTWNPTGPYQTVASWTGVEWSSADPRADAYYRFEEDGITHWRPLPPPPPPAAGE